MYIDETSHKYEDLKMKITSTRCVYLYHINSLLEPLVVSVADHEWPGGSEGLGLYAVEVPDALELVLRGDVQCRNVG